jgi:hypothetical protein
LQVLQRVQWQITSVNRCPATVKATRPKGIFLCELMVHNMIMIGKAGNIMCAQRERAHQIIDSLSDTRIREVLDYLEYIRIREELNATQEIKLFAL